MWKTPSHAKFHMVFRLLNVKIQLYVWGPDRLSGALPSLPGSVLADVRAAWTFDLRALEEQFAPVKRVMLLRCCGPQVSRDVGATLYEQDARLL